jgi:dTDP-glucose 4,6-dehydratase
MIKKETVIVTGGSGFIGTNLVRLLVKSGAYRVVNLDALTYAANALSLADLEGNPDYVFVKGNITDRELVSSLFAQYQPAGVMHLAAESHVDRSIVNAEDFVQTNVVGTYTMLEAARAYWNGLPDEQKKASASCMFPPMKSLVRWARRDILRRRLPMRPIPPIPHRRRPAIISCAPFIIRYGLPTVITNCSNNYGPYQFPEKMIPLMILNALSGKPLPVYGDGSNVRDWIYVEDHCKAVNSLLRKAVPGEVYTVGGSNEQKNINLVNQICKILDDVAPPEEIPQLREQGLEELPGTDPLRDGSSGARQSVRDRFSQDHARAGLAA